jgi:putative exporter of polyketide antibiotics
VGGSARLAALLLMGKYRFAILSSTAAGVIIMVFEFVEVPVIGSPPGVTRALQMFYFQTVSTVFPYLAGKITTTHRTTRRTCQSPS